MNDSLAFESSICILYTMFKFCIWPVTKKNLGFKLDDKRQLFYKDSVKSVYILYT